MEVVNDAIEASSLLTESITVETNDDQECVRKFINTRSSNGCKFPVEFKSGLDWMNTSKSLSFSEELKGKLVILDFFTYCCINCMHILPQLKALENEFSVEHGLVVIGVHSPKFPNEHSTANVEAAVKRYEIKHPVVNDHEEYLWNTLGVCCWPTLVVIGPDRELLLYLLGESHEELLRLFVKECLATFKAKGAISPRPIPEIGADNQCKKPQDLCFPGKVCATTISSGPVIAIADTGNHRVLVVNKNGDVQHVIGGKECGFKDGDFNEAKFHAPQGLTFTDHDTLYVADTENHAIRKIDLSLRSVKTVAGDGLQGEDKLGGGIGSSQRLSSPWDLAFISPGVLLIAMAGTHQIWAYFEQDSVFWRNKKYVLGSCVAVAGSGREENRNHSYPQAAGFAQPSGLAVCEDKHAVYVADSESSTVRMISLTDGKVSGVVGGMQDPQNLFAFGDKDGSGLDARLQHPLGVAWSKHKQALYVCDSYNHKIKLINTTNRHCSTLSGTSFIFNEPGGLCAENNILYVADTNSHCVKVINLDDNSVETMKLNFKKSEQKASKMLDPLKEEQVSIHRRGGELELTITVVCPSAVKPLEDSPPVWTLPLPDGYIETKAQAEEGVGNRWTVTVPSSDSNDRSSCQLRPQCRLFYCHNSLCSVRVLPFLVTLLFNDDAPTKVTAQVQYELSL